MATETLRATLNDLTAVAPKWLGSVANPEWFKRYAQRAEDGRLPGGSKEKREAYAREVGTDGFALLDALDHTTTPRAAREVPMVETLRQVWQTHFERHAGGPPRWRNRSEWPPVGQRIQSPYDPQMHYSTERSLEWSSYKVHVTETCDARSAHIITHVETRPAMEPDMSATAAIHKRLATRGLLPARHFVDSGYVDADLLVSSRRDYGVSLEGPVRKMSTWASRAGHGYDMPNFEIDWDRKHVTCPQDKVSVSWTSAVDSRPSPHQGGLWTGRLRSLQGTATLYTSQGRAPPDLFPPSCRIRST